jgi:RNA polymerase sigma factor (sigma-70 family)
MISATGVTEDERIYRAYAAELTRYATGLVGPFDAADVVSDACLRAFNSRGWSDVGNHRAYLYRAVFNVANDHHRATLSRRVREQRAATATTTAPVEIDVDVLEAVGRLSMQQRAAVLLTYWSDLPPDQVAEHMGISAGSVKRHLARARRRLEGWLT